MEDKDKREKLLSLKAIKVIKALVKEEVKEQLSSGPSSLIIKDGDFEVQELRIIDIEDMEQRNEGYDVSSHTLYFNETGGTISLADITELKADIEAGKTIYATNLKEITDSFKCESFADADFIALSWVNPGKSLWEEEKNYSMMIQIASGEYTPPQLLII